MPEGNIEIVEFRGQIVGVHRDEVITYLLSIDNIYQKKFRNPEFRFVPKSWRDKYLINSFEVGSAQTWTDFFARCAIILERERPFGKKEAVNRSSLPTEKVVSPERLAAEANSEWNEDENPVMSSIFPIFNKLLDEPLERPLSLKFEVTGYLSLLKEEARNINTIDLPVAQAIADGALELIKYLSNVGGRNTDDFRLLQAAIRYFTVSEDANSDFEEGGFDDDAAVFNLVAKKLGRRDLLIPLP